MAADDLSEQLAALKSDYFRCACTAAYVDRGLRDPQCNAHDGAPETIDAALAALRSPVPTTIACKCGRAVYPYLESPDGA